MACKSTYWHSGHIRRNTCCRDAYLCRTYGLIKKTYFHKLYCDNNMQVNLVFLGCWRERLFLEDPIICSLSILISLLRELITKICKSGNRLHGILIQHRNVRGNVGEFWVLWKDSKRGRHSNWNQRRDDSGYLEVKCLCYVWCRTHSVSPMNPSLNSTFLMPCDICFLLGECEEVPKVVSCLMHREIRGEPHMRFNVI